MAYDAGANHGIADVFGTVVCEFNDVRRFITEWYWCLILGRFRKHQIQPEHGDEQTDAERDCRTRLARPNSQARTVTGKYHFSRFS